MTIAWTPQSKYLEGKTALVTGGTTGVGLHAALFLANLGVNVTIASRNKERAKIALDRISRRNLPGKVSYFQLDLTDFSSIRSLADHIGNVREHLDYLINNSGIMMVPQRLTNQGIESQMATNHVGHFLLTALLLPLIEKSHQGRIVSVCSLAHRMHQIDFNDLCSEKDYSPMKAYARSKLASLLFAYELDRRLKKTKSRAISVAAHPGVAYTNLADHMNIFMRWGFRLIGQNARKGALPIVYAALNPQLKGGEYIGPLGIAGYRGRPGIVSSSPFSRDVKNSKKLWKASELWMVDNFIVD